MNNKEFYILPCPTCNRRQIFRWERENCQKIGLDAPANYGREWIALQMIILF